MRNPWFYRFRDLISSLPLIRLEPSNTQSILGTHQERHFPPRQLFSFQYIPLVPEPFDQLVQFFLLIRRDGFRTSGWDGRAGGRVEEGIEVEGRHDTDERRR